MTKEKKKENNKKKIIFLLNFNMIRCDFIVTLKENIKRKKKPFKINENLCIVLFLLYFKIGNKSHLLILSME